MSTPETSRALTFVLKAKGISVYCVEDDARARGIQADELVGGLTAVRGELLPSLFGGFEQVWHR